MEVEAGGLRPRGGDGGSIQATDSRRRFHYIKTFLNNKPAVSAGEDIHKSRQTGQRTVFGHRDVTEEDVLFTEASLVQQQPGKTNSQSVCCVSDKHVHHFNIHSVLLPNSDDYCLTTEVRASPTWSAGVGSFLFVPSVFRKFLVKKVSTLERVLDVRGPDLNNAAALASALPVSSIRSILKLLKDCPDQQTPEDRQLVRKCMSRTLVKILNESELNGRAGLVWRDHLELGSEDVS
ncbi:unnamed protein product [Pleuronectes platessa]|uniref:Uncharacterized protein n=1 Tax=Pleuronectes platessa TaxID=8262 RepID=A0A9N7YQ61_PLEPL|nr:unnamed protein product [Pleuronectes platessa]